LLKDDAPDPWAAPAFAGSRVRENAPRIPLAVRVFSHS
jgi:hypothetical protein